jgi:hypothetical protein
MILLNVVSTIAGVVLRKNFFAKIETNPVAIHSEKIRRRASSEQCAPPYRPALSFRMPVHGLVRINGKLVPFYFFRASA